MLLKDRQIKWLINVLSILVLGLIALGGAVRAMDAGLACPDWPLCFGQLIPDFHPQVYFEFIHRVLAGFVAILTLFLGLSIFKRKDYPKKARVLVFIIWGILIIQIIMGGLTVLKLLHFGAVTAHLFFGMAFFLHLVMLQFFITHGFPEKKKTFPGWVKGLSILVMVAVFGQIILGGLVSSNYAGLACPDFPLCHGHWIPPFMDDLIFLHLLHRFGAYTVFALIYINYILCRIKLKITHETRPVITGNRLMISLILIQILIGMSNVLFKIPPLVTVVHLFVAALLLAFATRNYLFISYKTAHDT